MKLCLLLAVGPLAGAEASAQEVFCIGSVANLVDQLPVINSSSRAGNALDLRFQSGYYDLGGMPGSGAAIFIERNSQAAPSRAHRISGGWNSGCTAQAALQNLDSSTVLDARGQRPLLRFRQRRGPLASGMDWAVHLRIDQLQFADGVGSCLDLGRDTSGSLQLARLDVTIERIRVELCGSMAFGATALKASTEGHVTLRNSLFMYNRGGAAAFNLAADSGVLAVFNNTLRGNQTAADGFSAVAALSGQTIYFQNNLVADSVYAGQSRDVYLVQGAAFVRNNRLAGAIHQANANDLLIASGNTADTPGFLTVQGPRLAASSPMRDRALSSVPAPGYGSVDWEGMLRVQGAAPEIGAFELPALPGQQVIFANGFEAH